jgi:hypothetical protein
MGLLKNHSNVTDVAQERLLDMNKSITEIAYEIALNTHSISPVYSNKKQVSRRMITG